MNTETHEPPLKPLHQIDPLREAAAVLVKLQSTLRDKPLEYGNVGEELMEMANRIVNHGDLHQLEAMLMGQAQVLHSIFTHATERYAESKGDAQSIKLYGNLALKAQNYCRQTLGILTRMKKPSLFNMPKPVSAKTWNELRKHPPFSTSPPSQPVHVHHEVSHAPFPTSVPTQTPKEAPGISPEEWIRKTGEGWT